MAPNVHASPLTGRLLEAWGPLLILNSGPVRGSKPWGPFQVERKRADVWELLCDNEPIVEIASFSLEEDGMEGYEAMDIGHPRRGEFSASTATEAAALCLAAIEKRCSPWTRACRAFDVATTQPVKAG